MPFKFEKLEVWQLSLDYTDDVEALASSFPKRSVSTFPTKCVERPRRFR